MKNSFKRFLKSVPFILSIYGHIRFQIHKYYFKKDPKKAANIDFKKFFKRNINWDSPTDLIEKIIWMQFNTDTTLWTVCADKYLVRKYVEEHGCGFMLNKLYGHYYSADEIDFNSLPKEFVLKPNNSCESVILVQNKSELDINVTRKKLQSWLKYQYGIMNAQLHYLRIKPCIIAEEFLHDTNDKNTSLTDYKITCFNGVPESILIVSDRKIQGDHSYVLNLYDTNWNSISENLCIRKNDKPIAKPKSLDKMFDACMKLGKNFPYVRIDFYEIDGNPFFGELTFTTGFGYFTNEYYNYLGNKIDLKKLTKKI